MASKDDLRLGLITIVPSMANFRSHKLSYTSLMTRCIRSNSCLWDKKQNCGYSSYFTLCCVVLRVSHWNPTWRRCSLAEGSPSDSTPLAPRMHCILAATFAAYLRLADKLCSRVFHHHRHRLPSAARLGSYRECLASIEIKNEQDENWVKHESGKRMFEMWKRICEIGSRHAI